MDGKSLIGVLTKGEPLGRDAVFIERERHVNCRKGDLAYPARAVRTKDFLYIRNFRPGLWPAGDPEMWVAVGPFGDIDTSPTKYQLLDERYDPKIKPYFELATAMRPAEELFDLRKDPWTLRNIAEDPEYAETRKTLSEQLRAWMTTTDDPRAIDPNDARWDEYAYPGNLGEWVIKKPKK